MPNEDEGKNGDKINKESEQTSDSDIQSNLPEEVKKVIEELPDEEQKVKLKAALLAVNVNSTHYRGPIPDPNMLQEYNNVVKDGAERIITQFEEQSRHRREIEKIVVNSESKESRRGQIFAFIIGMTGLGLAFVSAILGYNTFAITLASTTLVGLVSAFIVGKKIQTKDLEEKQ